MISGTVQVAYDGFELTRPPRFDQHQLSAAGMRTGEVHRLNLEDADLDAWCHPPREFQIQRTREITLYQSSGGALKDSQAVDPA